MPNCSHFRIVALRRLSSSAASRMAIRSTCSSCVGMMRSYYTQGFRGSGVVSPGPLERHVVVLLGEEVVDGDLQIASDAERLPRATRVLASWRPAENELDRRRPSQRIRPEDLVDVTRVELLRALAKRSPGRVIASSDAKGVRVRT